MNTFQNNVKMFILIDYLYRPLAFVYNIVNIRILKINPLSSRMESGEWNLTLQTPMTSIVIYVIHGLAESHRLRRFNQIEFVCVMCVCHLMAANCTLCWNSQFVWLISKIKIFSSNVILSIDWFNVSFKIKWKIKSE